MSSGTAKRKTTTRRRNRPSPRQRLLDAATKLFTEEGIRVIGIDRILRGSGETVSRLVKKIDEDLKPASFELKGAKIRFTTARRHLLLRNVAGKLPGSDPKLAAETIVIGGHYDHIGYGYTGSRAPGVHAIHPGADDNASGSAAVMMLAARLAGWYEGQPGDADLRSILFLCFSAEESGQIGSFA